MYLSKKAIYTIRHNSALQAKLMLAGDMSYATLDRWLKENSDNLTKAKFLKVIKEETLLTESEILEPETTNA